MRLPQGNPSTTDNVPAARRAAGRRPHASGKALIARSGLAVLAVSLATSLSLAMTAFADPPPASGLNSQPIILRECPILPINDIRVAVQVGGILDLVEVEEGEKVTSNQLLAKVRDEKARIEYEAAKVAAANKAPIEEARATLEEQQARRDNTRQLVARNAESKEKLREDDATVKIAEARFKNAEVKQVLDVNALELKAEEVLQHEVKSPIDGRVVEIIAKPGQAVEPLAPVIRVVDTQKVRIKGAIDLLNAERVREGMFLEVYPDITEGPQVTLLGHTAPVTAVVALSDNKHCVSASEDGLIIVWDIYRRVQERVFDEHGRPVMCLATSPGNADRIVSGDVDGNLIVWDISSGKTINKIETKLSGITAMVISPVDPNKCVTAHDDRSIRVWDLKTGEQKQMLSGHRSFITSLAMTDDGKRLLSTGDDQTVRLWDMTKGSVIRVDKGRSGDVRHIGFSDDGHFYLFNSFGNLEVRSTEDGRPVGAFSNPRGVFGQVALFAPESNLVLAGTSNDELELWQQGEPNREPRLVRRFRGHSDVVRAVDFSTDGTFFVSGGEDRAVKVWQVPSLELIGTEKLVGRVKFVNPLIESSQREMLAEIENIGNVLTPGRMATVAIYPGEKQEVAEAPSRREQVSAARPDYSSKSDRVAEQSDDRPPIVTPEPASPAPSSETPPSLPPIDP